MRKIEAMNYNDIRIKILDNDISFISYDSKLEASSPGHISHESSRSRIGQA
jgi:hypothetical protein